MPSASAVPGMSSTPSMSWISQSRSWLRTGANPTPQLPDHGGGHAVVAGRGDLRIPGHLAVVVGVDVDPTRRDEARHRRRSPGVPRPSTVADGDDAVAVDGDVAGGDGGCPVPSTMRPPRITRSCMSGSPLSCAGRLRPASRLAAGPGSGLRGGCHGRSLARRGTRASANSASGVVKQVEHTGQTGDHDGVVDRAPGRSAGSRRRRPAASSSSSPPSSIACSCSVDPDGVVEPRLDLRRHRPARTRPPVPTRSVGCASDRVGEERRPDEGEGAPSPVDRVGAGVGVADGVEAEHARTAFVDRGSFATG